MATANAPAKLSPKLDVRTEKQPSFMLVFLACSFFFIIFRLSFLIGMMIVSKRGDINVIRLYISEERNVYIVVYTILYIH